MILSLILVHSTEIRISSVAEAKYQNSDLSFPGLCTEGNGMQIYEYQF